jgi:Protein of unknown function (DUF1203)
LGRGRRRVQASLTTANIDPDLLLHGRGRHLLAQEHVSNGNFEPVIEKLFASPEVDYLQVNSTTAGCFTFRIERAID